MSRKGWMVLAIGMVVTLVWVASTPEILNIQPGQTIACTEGRPCVPDTAGMALRFVMGSFVALVLALAVSAVMDGHESDEEHLEH